MSDIKTLAGMSNEELGVLIVDACKRHIPNIDLPPKYHAIVDGLPLVYGEGLVKGYEFGESKFKKQIEELQRQNAMLVEAASAVIKSEMVEEYMVEADWEPLYWNMYKAISATSDQSAAWLEASHIEWMKGLEVTDEMLTAGAKMFEATLHSAADFKHHASHIFYAMLDAIPTKKD